MKKTCLNVAYQIRIDERLYFLLFSASCGGGTSQRTRVCIDVCTGCQCIGAATEIQSCNTQPCCVWSSVSLLSCQSINNVKWPNIASQQSSLYNKVSFITVVPMVRMQRNLWDRRCYVSHEALQQLYRWSKSLIEDIGGVVALKIKFSVCWAFQ